MLSRWPTNRPFGSLAASGTLSKFFGLKATNRPFLPSALAAGRLGMGEHVDRDAAGVHLLLEAAQDGRAAGAEHLDLDAGLLLEGVGDLLRPARSASRCTRSPCPRPSPWRRRRHPARGRAARRRARASDAASANAGLRMFPLSLLLRCVGAMRLPLNVRPCRSAPAARRSTPGCDSRSRSSSAGTRRARCPASRRTACPGSAAS